KASKRWYPIVIVDHQRTARLNREPADFVALELLAFLLRRFERGRIHYLIDRNDFTFHILGGEAQIVKMPNSHRVAYDPENVRVNPVRLDRCFSLMRCDVTALDKTLLGQGDPD